VRSAQDGVVGKGSGIGPTGETDSRDVAVLRLYVGILPTLAAVAKVASIAKSRAAKDGGHPAVPKPDETHADLGSPGMTWDTREGEGARSDSVP